MRSKAALLLLWVAISGQSLASLSSIFRVSGSNQIPATPAGLWKMLHNQFLSISKVR
jgi:hypothetical protein